MVKADKNYIIEIRRKLHRVPELGFELNETLKIVRNELEKLGIDYTEELGKSSIVATINPDSKGKVIAIRADMDALPIQENTGLPYSSIHEGKMHACGHDCHTAMLLGTAKMLAEIQDQLTCKVKLIFQAAEEKGGGARLLCLDGVMNDVDYIIGCHVTSSLDTGKVALNNDVMNASSRSVAIILHGKASHVSSPHLGVDAIAMACRVFNDIQIMRAREMNPMKPLVIGFGEIHGGTARNVICDKVILNGTVRSLDADSDQIAIRRIEEITASVCNDMHGSYEIDCEQFYPVLKNTPAIAEKLTKISKEMLGEDAFSIKPISMGAEDFAWYLQEKPGAFFSLGVRKPGTKNYPLHNEKFTPDEDALTIAPEIFTQFVLENM